MISWVFKGGATLFVGGSLLINLKQTKIYTRRMFLQTTVRKDKRQKKRRRERSFLRLFFRFLLDFDSFIFVVVLLDTFCLIGWIFVQENIFSRTESKLHHVVFLQLVIPLSIDLLIVQKCSVRWSEIDNVRHYSSTHASITSFVIHQTILQNSVLFRARRMIDR